MKFDQYLKSLTKLSNDQVIFLEFWSRFSDVLNGTGNRSMKVRMLDKIDNVEKI
jgi:hypothetical protein